MAAAGGRGGSRRRVGDWAVWRMPRPALAVILAVELLAFAGLGLSVAYGQPPSWGALLAAVLLTAGGVVHTEITRWVERTRRRVTPVRHIDLTSVWTYSGALILPAALACAVVLATYAYIHFRVLRPSRTPLYRQLYSTSTVLLAAQAVSAVLALLQPPTLLSGTGLAVLLLTIAVYTLVNSSLIVTVIVLTNPDASVRSVVGRGREVAIEFATLGLGAVFAAVTIIFGPVGLLFALPAALLLQWAILDWQLDAQAQLDKRTDLPNAAAWYIQARHLMTRHRQHTGICAVLAVELDQAGRIEELYGFAAVTEALRTVAAAIRAVTVRRDAVGWFGSGLFALMVPDTDGRSLAMRIRAAVATRPLVVNTPDGPITVPLSVTIGVAESPSHGRSATAVLAAAESALETARHQGGGGEHFAGERQG